MGETIDDFFNRLKNSATAAAAPLKMVCSILVSQLPESIQGTLHTWVDEREAIEAKDAPAFLVKVKTALMEKRIPLDHGYKDMTRIAYMTLDEQPVPRELPDLECNARTEIAASNSSDETRTINAAYRDRRGPSNKKRSAYYADNTKGYGTITRGPSSRVGCFVCGSSRHFMVHCPEKHCPKCGKKGHELRACPDSGSRKIFTTSAPVRTTRETSVVITVSLNGKQTDAMLGTGADPSVVDRVKLRGLGINYQ